MLKVSLRRLSYLENKAILRVFFSIRCAKLLIVNIYLSILLKIRTVIISSRNQHISSFVAELHV